jgi:hypothetical protein
MKRIFATATTLAALLAGCEQNTPPAHSSAEPMKSVATTDTGKAMPSSSSSSAQPAGASAKPMAAPSAKEYYEVNKNGKTYVFGKLDDVLAFRSSGTLPADAVEKPAFGPMGETVVFQTGGMEQGLMAEYQKAHPAKK